MGLDMYLSKRHFVKNYDYMEPEEKTEIVVLKGNKHVSNINISKMSAIEEDVAYWRKFNALHKWFVENVQDGEDNCKDYWVDREKLQELLSLLKLVIADKERADELLPTTEGFFFGGTEYDQYYFDNVNETIQVLEKELALNDTKCDYYYSSSW